MTNTSRLCMNHQTGTSLLEALIAIVVLAFGMLGVAGLNLASLKVTQEGGNRNVAAVLTQELADKLRATNEVARIAAIQGLGNAAIDSTLPLPNCYTAPCSAAQQVTHELVGWAKSIDNADSDTAEIRARTARLPGGRGTVCFDDSPNEGTPENTLCSNDTSHPLVIKIWWNERPSNATEATPTQVLSATSIVL